MSASAGTDLARALAERIRRDGPMPVAAYMAACLHDQEHGYYRRKIAIGAAGDFITAPEISQAFGELIGLWCALVWRAMGAPAATTLIELGPGRGTLLSDALRAARLVPGFRESLSNHLVESNAALRDVQAVTLGRQGVAAAWHDWPEFDAIRAGPTLLVANEFLDAFPIEQLVYADGTWHRREIGLDRNGVFVFVRGPAVEPSDLAMPPTRPPEGAIFEHRPALAEVASQLARRSRSSPLAALFIDYGPAEPAFGDSLQAVKAHRYASPLENPGEADLTAHVDFAALSRRCGDQGLIAEGPITQGRFLLAMGLVERTEKLVAAARPDQIGLIEAGARRIADPAGMGGLFKVFCVRTPGLPRPPPFALPRRHEDKR
jgi:NADH dehydrogenase [ubiquinone] 1 alpha subcomplex assembly factor 7